MSTSTALTPLTGNREMFASLVASGSNYSDAYREAFDASGMAATTLHTEASWLARVPEVSLRIAEIRAEAFQAVGVTVERVSRELAAVAFSDIADVATWDGSGLHLTPFDQLSPAARRAVKAIKVKRSRRVDGSRANPAEWETEHIEIQLWDKVGALEKLARHLGMDKGAATQDNRVQIIVSYKEPEDFDAVRLRRGADE